MREFMKIALAAAFAVDLFGIHAASAADLYPQGQYEAPPPQAYEPPTQGYGYPAPPPVAYGYPPLVAYYEYAPPPYVVVPPPYYAGGPYWRGYAPRYAYAHGHWGHGYRRW
jgi:hypothetical protein